MGRYLIILCFLFSASLAASYGGSQRRDFIIVGGGTAGCVMAARLCSAMPYQTFTLMERSNKRNATEEFRTRAPLNNVFEFEMPILSEVFTRLSNPGLGPDFIGTTGNTLGGSSSTNGMQFVVPVGGTVERWGIRGLTTRRSRRYYRRVVRTLRAGPQTGNLRNIYANLNLRAARRSGIQTRRGLFDESPDTFMYHNVPAIDKRGRRRDSCTSYLAPVLKYRCKHNLKLMRGVTVTRILFNSRKRAQGVEYVNSDSRATKMQIFASKEVILSAGPYGTPKLLQLSGIGPGEVLRSAGVVPFIELPVGARTQSRYALLAQSTYTAPLDPANNATVLDDPATRAAWEAGQASVLGQSAITLAGRSKLDGYLFAVSQFLTSFRGQKIISIGCSVNPSAFGFYRIRSSDPFEEPDVQLNLAGNQADIDKGKRCMNVALNVHRNFPASFGIQIVNPANGIVDDDFIRRNAFFTYHYVGGAKVGEVTRPDLTVRSTHRLRVVDASVLGDIPTGAGPMASVYMVAEYAADMVINKYR